MVVRGAPAPTFLNGKINQGRLCIIFKGIYGRFRIKLSNCKFTKFGDFASWSQKSGRVKLVKVLLSIKYYEIRINQIIN